MRPFSKGKFTCNYPNKILSRLLVTIEVVVLVNGFIDHLQVETTNNCNNFVDFYATNNSTLSLPSLLSLVVAW
jgi:hypothetical protein